MTDTDPRPIPDAIHDAAADWLQKRDRGVDAATEARFQAWRSSSDAHRRAYDRLEQEWRLGGRLGETATGQDRALVPAPFYLRRNTQLGAASIAAAALIGGSAALVPHRWWPTSIVAEAQAQSFQTGVGEIRTVALTDGSKVTLDTNTRVVLGVSPSRRSATLDHGRARFAIVANAAGPFVVHLKTGAIEADRAEFDAATDGGADGRVRVLSGSVKIAGTLERTDERARVSVAPDQPTAASLAPPSSGRIATKDDWTSGMIALDATPIAAAIAEINRYNRVQVRLDAPGVAAVTMSGGFRARDPMGFAEAVAALHGLRIVRPSPDLIVLTMRH